MIYHIHPIAEIFPKMPDSEFASLRQDIQENGLLEAIWLYEGKVLDGRHRYRACYDLRIQPEFRQYEGDNPLGFVISLNLKRRHLDESQRGMVGARIANMRVGGDGSNQHGQSSNSANLPNCSQSTAAEMLNTSTRTITSSSKVLKDGTPELVEAVDSGLIPVSQAAKLATATPEFQNAVVARVEGGVKPNEAVRVEKAAAISEKHIEAPTGKFRIIYADPPWSYGNSMPDSFVEQRDHYPVMTIRELCDMPIKALAEDDAVLFLWVTSPILEESFEIIKAWGFKYKASFVWDKEKHVMGHYNSVRHEFLLVCVRGSCQPDVRKLFDSVVTEARTEHSKKPAQFYDIIETIYTQGKRLEIFARNQREGWTSYGFEDDKFSA